MKNVIIVKFLFVSVPTKPLNLTTSVITSNSIDLSWIKPEKANGVIGGYRIYYIHENFTSVETHKVSENLQQNRTIEFTLNNLSKSFQPVSFQYFIHFFIINSLNFFYYYYFLQNRIQSIKSG